ncbi:MAG TPA: GNAT family N-acetyltransferase, partial [bacterium]|nr:GNAT family N-acetyltransferase [bacterium]
DYANDLARNHHLPIDQARSDAARAIDGMLTKGLATPTHELSNIILRADAAEQRIGYLWIQVEDTKKTCFIAEIYLHPEFRGRGLGRKVLEDLEVRLRQRGIERIGLHVFADNRAASALYTKMGYQITGLHMVKMLTR